MHPFHRLAALGGLALASTAALAGFDTFTALPASVPAGSLPEATPFKLSNPLFSQTTLDANAPLSGRRGDNRDMVTAIETGPNADDGVAESMGRWASMSTAGAEPSGLHFDKFNADSAYVDVQHADSDVDCLIQISAVPEPEAYTMLLGGMGVVGFVARRRRGRAR